MDSRPTRRKFHFFMGSGPGPLSQGYDGGSPASGLERGIREALHKRGFGQDRPYHFALNADSTAMNNPERLEPQAAGLLQVLLDDRSDIPGRNRMEVEDIRDRNPERFW